MVVALESSRENAVNLFHSGIFIFSMKNMFIDVIQIQAFELLVFTRIQSKTPPPILLVVLVGQQSNHSGESCQLGCYLIYLCLIKHIAGLH